MVSPASALRQRIRGTVHDDLGTRGAYGGDASTYRAPPAVVVVPVDTADLLAAVHCAAELGLTVVARGAGTSVAGNAIGGDLLLDLRRLNRIEGLDPLARTARVQPGVVLDQLRTAAAAHGLTFGADPSTHNRATLGGMIGNNACGAHSVAWGTTADNVDTLDLVLPDGSCLTASTSAPDQWARQCARSGLYQGLNALIEANLGLLRTGMPRLRRRVSGYALDRLLPEQQRHLARALVGTEGSCAIATCATVRLVPLPAARVLLVLAFADPIRAAQAVPTLLRHTPLTVESLDATLVALALGGEPPASADGGQSPTSGRRDAASPHRGDPLDLETTLTRLRLPPGASWLLVEVGADSTGGATDLARSAAQEVRDLTTGSVVLTDAREQQALWKIRENGAGLATRLPDGSEAWPGWEDAAVPPERLAEYLTRLDDLVRDHGRQAAIYGHFGEGCLHARFDFDLTSPSGVGHYRRFVEEAADLVIGLGGSVSGEHGDGRARSQLLARMYPPAMLEAFAAFKAVFDPDGRFNPGMVVRALALDAQLRAPALRPVQGTVFGYRADGGDFTRAVRRCVGIGRCVVAPQDQPPASRGVMCPSWQATADERHSTRGRARILAEMLDGRLDPAGWRSRAVRDALDLCLSCKACLSECPVNVDMATFRAEFLHHHYRWRLRPLAHYSLGWLPTWLTLADRIPGAPALLGIAGRSGLLRRLAGLDPTRRLPLMATRSFRRGRWHPVVPAADGPPPVDAAVDGPGQADTATGGPRPAEEARDTRSPVGPVFGGPRVILWPDTFSDHLSPEVLQAAARVLTAAGLRIELPPEGACCGLTWITTGQLDRARQVLRRTLRLIPDEPDVPIVVLEPSCAAVLRRDLVELLPHDHAAGRLASRVRTLAEALLPRRAPLAHALRPAGVPTPVPVRARVLVQVHCHHRAVLGSAADLDLLRELGFEVQVLDSGCCGLAGSFGFEAGHGEISRRIAAQRLLPALAQARPGDVILADGYSCRTQIAELSPHRARHLAELLATLLPDPARGDEAVADEVAG